MPTIKLKRDCDRLGTLRVNAVFFDEECTDERTPTPVESLDEQKIGG